MIERKKFENEELNRWDTFSGTICRKKNYISLMRDGQVLSSFLNCLVSIKQKETGV